MRTLTAFLALTLFLPSPALGLRVQAGLESDSQPELTTALSAGAEEPSPPWWPKDFGHGEFCAVSIGGIESYTIQPGDKIF